jgi:AcrR family transcriptional regulator
MAPKPQRLRDAQASATRDALLAAARGLFARRGYAQVSVDEIVQAAGLTKGALYHHFEDKRQLFRGVVEQVQRQIRERLRAAAAGVADPHARLRAACHAYLDACTEDEVGRIVVLDSPAVLGWDAWCKINREYGLGFFVEQLAALGRDERAAESSAQMLLGALDVAGRVIAQAGDRGAARGHVAPTVERMLAGMAAPS